MIKIEKKIHESASLVIKSGPSFSKTNALKAKDELVANAYQTTPKKNNDPAKEQKRGSELNKEMRSRRNDSDIRPKENVTSIRTNSQIGENLEDIKSQGSSDELVTSKKNKSTAPHTDLPKSKDNQNSSQTTAFNSRKTNIVTYRGGYKDNMNLINGTQASIVSSPTKQSYDFNKRSTSP